MFYVKKVSSFVLTLFILQNSINGSFVVPETIIQVTRNNFKQVVLDSEKPVLIGVFSFGSKKWNKNLPLFQQLSEECSLKSQQKSCEIMWPIFVEVSQNDELQKKYVFAVIDVDQDLSFAAEEIDPDELALFEIYYQGNPGTGFGTVNKSIFESILLEENFL